MLFPCFRRPRRRLQVLHARAVATVVRRYLRAVILCQRLVRRVLARGADRRREAARRWTDAQMQEAAQELLAGLEELAALTVQGGRARPAPVPVLAGGEVARLPAEQRGALERAFPGVPAWVAAGLDRAAFEITKVLLPSENLTEIARCNAATVTVAMTV